MKQVRQHVFETNSSSTHSICIAQEAELEIPQSLHFGFGEFGWECDTLYSIETKARYLYTGLIANHRKDDAMKIFATLQEKGIEVTYAKAVLKKCKGYSYYKDAGYVDHSDELQPFLNRMVNDVDALMRYLFSPLSFIITGNDNDDEDMETIEVDYPYEEYYKGN